MSLTTMEPWWDWPLETPIIGIMSWVFPLRQTWRKRIRGGRWTTSRERETVHLFSPERQKKPSQQPPAWCYIISPGLTPRLKFIIDRPSNQQPLQFSPIHLWPVGEANCLSWGHWAAKMAHTRRLGMSPARRRLRSSANVRRGERPRERQHIPKCFKCVRNGGARMRLGSCCLTRGDMSVKWWVIS